MYPLIGSYIHHNREKAAMVVLSFETDFAARTKEAIEAANKLAMLACGFCDIDQKEIPSYDYYKLMKMYLLNNGGQEIIDDLCKLLKEKIKLVFINYIDGWEEIKIKI